MCSFCGLQIVPGRHRSWKFRLKNGGIAEVCMNRPGQDCVAGFMGRHPGAVLNPPPGYEPDEAAPKKPDVVRIKINPRSALALSPTLCRELDWTVAPASSTRVAGVSDTTPLHPPPHNGPGTPVVNNPKKGKH
jgi:hypothetical protein